MYTHDYVHVHVSIILLYLCMTDITVCTVIFSLFILLSSQHPSYLVPFPVQILSLFLAFATRRVKVKGLNDTKAVAGAVYVTSITFTVLFVCTYTVLQYINVYAAIFCVAFFIGTTTILALLYIPKVSGCVSMNCLAWLSPGMVTASI